MLHSENINEESVLDHPCNHPHNRMDNHSLNQSSHPFVYFSFPKK